MCLGMLDKEKEGKTSEKWLLIKSWHQPKRESPSPSPGA